MKKSKVNPNVVRATYEQHFSEPDVDLTPLEIKPSRTIKQHTDLDKKKQARKESRYDNEQ
jgi:hypothetical protein